MMELRLRITLKSDATFGRGDGIAGVTDTEVQHDRHGFPFLGGKTLKGLLGAECADILFALKRACPKDHARWKIAGQRLFGESGAMLQGEAILLVGPAQLPDDLRAAVARDIAPNSLTREEVLETLTTLRRQTAMDIETGAPKQETLRTMRVILRETVFDAPLRFTRNPTPDELALLAASIKAFRRAGAGRNRGRGRLSAELYDQNGRSVTEFHFEYFRQEAIQ
jgi:hypothetical protein